MLTLRLFFFLRVGLWVPEASSVRGRERRARLHEEHAVPGDRRQGHRSQGTTTVIYDTHYFCMSHRHA